MKNKIFRHVDSQGRITIPYFLFEHTNIKKGDILAFVSVGKDMISIVPYDESTNMKVIHKSIMGEKNRIIIPRKLREVIESVEVFFYNGYITIK